MTRECIEQHVDQAQLEILRTVEADERQVLEPMAAGLT
jgi:hypothetical protein